MRLSDRLIGDGGESTRERERERETKSRVPVPVSQIALTVRRSLRELEPNGPTTLSNRNPTAPQPPPSRVNVFLKIAGSRFTSSDSVAFHLSRISAGPRSRSLLLVLLPGSTPSI